VIACADVEEALLLGRALDRAAAAHLAGCDACRAAEAELRALAGGLAADRAEPPPRLEARVLAAATPLLARNAQREMWRRSLRAVAAALVPLPLVLAVNVLFARALYTWLQGVLPAELSLFVIWNYAALVALLCAAIYGAIPLLAARQVGLVGEVRHG
jgi:hypothetical protein